MPRQIMHLMKPKTHNISLRAGILGLLVVSSFHTASAGEPSGKAVEPLVTPPPPSSIFSVDLGVTVANQYNTRGIIVQDDDVSFQPYLNWYTRLHEGDGFVKSAKFFVGLWADVSTNGDVSGPGNRGSYFTEFDYGIGLTFNFAERWTFTTFWNNWTSPADGYGDGSWINGTLAFNDSGIFGKNFSFKPYVIALYDLGGDAATGLVKETWYFEPGIRPNYTFGADSKLPVNVAVLAKAGLGNDFYAGETYGYFAVGPQVTLSLNSIPAHAGKWAVSFGYLYYNLGDTLSPITGNSDEHLFTFNVGVSF